MEGTMAAVKAYTKIPEGCAECFKCGGGGKYYSGGAVVNGKYTGKVGDCYGCAGKGYQTPADVKRNRAYWRLNIHRYA
jgi:hypothetical protein